MARFYENPMAVLDEYAEKKVTAATEPLNNELNSFKTEREWNQAIGQIETDAAHFPEFQNVRGRMGEILKEKPYLIQSGDKGKALADAYAIAMSEKGFAQPAAPVQQPIQAPAPMDAASKVKMLMDDPEVAKLYQMELAKQIQSQNQQVPPMSPSSGVANVAPYIQNSPKDWNELDADIKNSIGQGLL